jgi:hypothetical protein
MADLGPAWIGLAGVAAGSIISTVGTYLVVRANARSAAAQRTHERQMAEETRDADEKRARDSYQVETLIELQLALQRFARATAASHYEDTAHHRRTREAWGSQLLGEHWSRMLLESSTMVGLLCARVADDETRQVAQLAHAAISAVTNATSEADAEDRMAEAIGAVEGAHDRIGRLLRTLPPPASYRPIVTSPFAEPPELEPPEPEPPEPEPPS